MGKSLEILLEREFNLCYYVPGFTHSDVRNMDSMELNWFYGKLVQQLKEEKESK